jgi:hypothetical protein
MIKVVTMFLTFIFKYFIFFGVSFDFIYTIHEWERMHKKLKYVALSRATKKGNINII